jgi:prepilin-type N-terminal cleavage/methylation domain-containing protein
MKHRAKTRTMFSKGFTLVELLIVIAILSILASVVFGSVNDARDKSADASVRTNLKGLRDQMALYYDENGLSYAGACSTDQNIMSAMTGARENVSAVLTLGGQGDGECFENGSDWSAWVNLKSASTSAFCVDSAGATSIIPTQDSSLVDLTVCP